VASGIAGFRIVYCELECVIAVSETETWYERVGSSNAAEEIAAAVPPVMQFQLQVFIVYSQFL
jgi:hypothetical protein